MRVLGAIVASQLAPPVAISKPEDLQRGPVRAQTVRRDGLQLDLAIAHQLQGSSRVPLGIWHIVGGHVRLEGTCADVGF